MCGIVNTRLKGAILLASTTNFTDVKMNYHPTLALKPNITKTKIISSGAYLPDEIVQSNEIFSEFDSEKNYGIHQDWMSETMGIVERRFSREDQTPSDLAAEAALIALEKCPEIDRSDIGLVVFCGIERDQPEPATAHLVQDKIGVKADIAFDVANACFGFIDGLRIAENFIVSGVIDYALITTGEIPSRLTKNFIDQLKKGIPADKFNDIVGFLSVGDAGGAVIMGKAAPGDGEGFELFKTISRSNHSDKCYYKHSDNGQIEGQMLMAKIVAKTLRLQFDNIPKTLGDLGWDTPDFFMTHQVGKKAFDAAAGLGITPKDRMIKSFHNLGNITSATFPVNHDQLMSRSDIKSGDKVYCCYSGSGIVIGQFGYTL